MIEHPKFIPPTAEERAEISQALVEIERMTRVLAKAWHNIHANELLGFQRMLSGELYRAGYRKVEDSDG